MHSRQDSRVRLNPPKEGVARAAKHLPNRAACMAMIHDQRNLHCANCAASVLRSRHSLDLRNGQSVTLAKLLPAIQSARRLRIRRTPAPQTVVAGAAVRGGVLRAAPVRTGSTVRAPVAPRLSESGERQSFFAVRASTRVHSATIHQHDQPCHADVLLELANPEPHP